jgi:circadian clock protein KaiB
MQTLNSSGEPVAKLFWNLRLYVAGFSMNTIAARANIIELCDEYLGEHYSLEVIDILENPEVAEKDRIMAVPMLVRREPHPVRKIIGDLSDVETVIAALDLRRLRARRSTAVGA